MKDIRIALVASNSSVNAVENNLKSMANWVKLSQKKGAALVCFPEMNITGYSNNVSIKSSAELIPGPSTDHISALAKAENIVILAGIAEKDEKNRIFASHVVVAPDGFIGVYRKLHIAPPERNIFTPGCRVPLFRTLGITFGIQLCYDAHFPELSTSMALKGADVIFFPHASPRGTSDEKFKSWMRHLPARAYDNGIFVVACNQVGENGKGLTFPGLALAIDPSGQLLKRNLTDHEGVLIVDLSANDLKRVRHHKMRYFLPNRRSDLCISDKS
jgi:N-carbamoylputrescine amidase